jgi:hypothetical protein
VYTIGSPRVGDAGFKALFEKHFPNAFRLANYQEGLVDRQDLVTQVPPKALGYRHAGELVRFSTDKLTLLGRSSAEAGFSDPEAVNDPVDAELESLRGEALNRNMAELMSGAAAENPAEVAQGTQEGFAVPSVSAHSSGVYLERIARRAVE